MVVVIDVEPIRERFLTVAPFLDERGRRLVAAAEAFAVGYGGTLLHGSIVRRRGLEGISGPRFLTLGRHRAIQSEPRSPSSHPEAAAQSDELGCL